MSRRRDVKNEKVAAGMPSAAAPDSVDPGVRLSQATPALLDYYSILSMVMGGCCVNFWAYEQLLMMNARIGSALTFSHVVFITAQSLPSFLFFPPGHRLPRLKPRQVPLLHWAVQVLLLTTSSLLYNWAFAYNVQVSILVVFRSAGLAVSMLFGFLFAGKRYTVMQVVSVLLVSAGVILATLARPSSSKTKTPIQSADDVQKYTIGISMLVISLVLTGFFGLLQERTYRTFGPCWKEGVFYTHFLSLPVFLFLVRDVQQGLGSLSDPAQGPSAMTSWLILGLNLCSQLVCVSGVNKLSSQVSSVSMNIVLTVRKAISLCFSVWWFGNPWNAGLGIGASMVFCGSLLFTTGWVYFGLCPPVHFNSRVGKHQTGGQQRSMQSYQLPQFPSHFSSVHAALYTDVSDSDLLRKRLITASTAEGSDGERERDAVNFAFIEARLITSVNHLRTAIYQAVLAESQGRAAHEDRAF
ncbi:Glucooligosaccharide oxidase [Mycena venus]|uniref:EKC/KEOPS complex subunit CGI121 n=1 Tax=Mycena venus TaxID=2733690 RepID=A0A8H6YVH5_9AGAR|nr:Glucooligosaccharide oxidase [Mycena venus]